MLCLFFGLARAQAQDAAPVTNPVPAPASARALSGAPLFWAEGITSADDLAAYKSIGFNAVVVRLTWNPDPDNLAALDLAPQRDFAQSAAKAGLKIIYALPAVPQGMEFTAGRIAGDSPRYNLLWKSWALGAIGALRDTPNLVGWMLPDDPRALPIFDDAGFRRWVGRNYASLDIVNARWGSSFRALDDITMTDANELAQRWQKRGQSDTYALAPLGSTLDGETSRGDNLAFHPAALALGAYKWEAYRTLLSMWIGEVRGADAGHLLFSGALPDYAQMLSMPAGVDVMTPAVTPGVAENDVVTHNPQAIDIARRGGKFAALPIFTARASAGLPAEDLPDLSKRWMQEACARGAAGVAFDSWDAFKTNLNLRQSTLEKLAELTKAPALALWNEPPVATTAVILTPLADGATLGFGPVALGQRRGLYGWAQDLVEGEPSNLVWALRWGTVFGGVDYLSPDDLDGPLDLYSTILAPQMLSCSLDNQTALVNYVGAGGVLVADLGLGALQNGGEVRDLPPGMKLLFGVAGNYDVRPVPPFNLNAVAPHPLLPSWDAMMRQAKSITLTQGDGMAGGAFGGPVAFSLVAPSATTVATGPQIDTKTLGGTFVLRAPLTINDAGRGSAIWAPFRLWSSWRPGNGGFDFFHGDLMARGATLAIRPDANGSQTVIVPAPVTLAEGMTRFPEIINRAADVSFADHDAPGQAQQLTSVETVGVGDWLWSGGIVQLSNATAVGLTGGRPAPIGNPEPIESRLRPLNLYASLAPGELKTLHMEPVSAQNLGGGPLCAQILSHTRGGLELNVWPNALTVLPSMAGDEWQPVPTVAAPFRVTVYSSDNGLKFAPGARVRAVLTSYEIVPNKRTRSKTAQQLAVADARGRVSFEFEGSACRLQIAPVT